MGYLVQSSCLSKLMTLYGPAHTRFPVHDGPENGILLHCHEDFPPTVFATKKLAEEAIKRTIAYGKKLKLKTFIKENFSLITEQALAELAAAKTRVGKKRKKH